MDAIIELVEKEVKVPEVQRAVRRMKLPRKEHIHDDDNGHCRDAYGHRSCMLCGKHLPDKNCRACKELEIQIAPAQYLEKLYEPSKS